MWNQRRTRKHAYDQLWKYPGEYPSSSLLPEFSFLRNINPNQPILMTFAIIIANIEGRLLYLCNWQYP